MFRNNEAQIQGGAISYWSARCTDPGETNVYQNNKAGYHSPDVASYAAKLKVIPFEEKERHPDAPIMNVNSIQEALERVESSKVSYDPIKEEEKEVKK